METYSKMKSSHMKPRISVKKENFSEDVLHSVKALLQSRKELCNVSAGEWLKEGNEENVIEIMFLGFADETDASYVQELAAISVELSDLVKSLHFCSLSDNEVIFLKDVKKPTQTSDGSKLPNYLSDVICVMRISPMFLKLKLDSVFSLLSRYTAGVRYTVDLHSVQKQHSRTSLGEDDDTNQSVSSIEDDFVTAFEHLEEEPSAVRDNASSNCGTSRNQRDAASQTIKVHCSEDTGSKIIVSSLCQKSSAKSAASMTNIMGIKKLSSSVKSSVTTLISDSWKQKSFYRPCSSSDQVSYMLPKTMFPSSPAESSESECSSPSPIIFLDEESYQKSLKAKLDVPNIPVVKDGIEDSDSELSEFFDSFDQFDDLDQCLESTCKLIKEPTLGNPPQKRKFAQEKSCSTSTMNPQNFKFDRPTLPANVRKPTPRKLESPYSTACDVPDSPRPVKSSSEDTGTLFSPIRSSAFSPLGSCAADYLYQIDSSSREGIRQNDCTFYNTFSDYANSVSFEILDSILHSQTTSLQKHKGDISCCGQATSKNEEVKVKLKRKSFGKETDRKAKFKHKPLMIKNSIQKFATELVEKSFGSAFKELQKGVSSCTSALCHLAAKLTSSVFQMAFYEIGRRRAFLLKQHAINSLANFLVGEAMTGALRELQYVKKQIFTNTVTRFAADLAEELVFEGIMEVCQFSHPPTPTTSQYQGFEFGDPVVQSYAKDLSESVIQEAFIELSQVDVTFTTQAAISVSVDNIKYVSAENTFQSTQTSNTFPNFQERALIAPNLLQESKKECTIQEALFFTTGIVSSIPVPPAGRVLCQPQTMFHVQKAMQRTLPLSTDSFNMCNNSMQNPDFVARKNEEEKSSPRNIYLNSEHKQIVEDSQYLHKYCDVEPKAKDFSVNNGTESNRHAVLQNYSGTLLDIVVSEAYEVIRSSRVTKTVEEYADYLTRKIVPPAAPHSQILDEGTSKNQFADHLTKHIICSAAETKSKLSNVCQPVMLVENLYPAAINWNTKLTGATKKQELEKQDTVSSVMQEQQMQLKLSIVPVSSSQCSLTSARECAQEHKNEVDMLCSNTLFGSNVNLRSLNAEGFADASSYSVKCLHKPMQNGDDQNTQMTSFVQENWNRHINGLSSTMFSCGDSLQMDDKPNTSGMNSIVIPNAPPTTPYPVSSEWNLKKLTKKLKGALAKEFAPATPPSTPHTPSVTGLSDTEHDSIPKEEFIFKLMRSLSEEVESSKGEEHSGRLSEPIEGSEKTVNYADHLASNIISMATEMAAFYLDDKVVPGDSDKKYSVLRFLNERWGYANCMKNISEETLKSLWNYAGDLAGDVISDAKKMLSLRHCKLLRLKKVNGHIDCFYFRKKGKECRPKERLCAVTDQWPREVDLSVLSLPSSLCPTGLISKYPSCESVTEEYADHIIRVLKKEGANSDLIMDQYASRLAYRSIKSGLQQAARNIKLNYNKRVFPVRHLQGNGKYKTLRLFNKQDNQEIDAKRQIWSGIAHHCEDPACENSSVPRNDCSGLFHFAESLAHTITCDVRKKLKMSAVCLPKSLTDSCLYRKSNFTEVAGDIVKTTFSKTLVPLSERNKLYHSTGSLNEYSHNESLIQTIDQYARKVVDDTLEMSFETVSLQATDRRKSIDRFLYAEKLSQLSETECRYCSIKEQPYSAGSLSPYLTGQDSSSRLKKLSKSKHGSLSQKPRVFHFDMPKIHIDLEQRAIFAERLVTAAIEKAERELSNTSLAADSGIGQDGISFAESLTTEIMTSAMTNIGQAANISCVGKDGFPPIEPVSQQMNLSVGDDSTGSWSNLSFEDEHPDESSSFLHLSDSNGNSSSWSSLGLEGEMYEENISFPPSDSDGAEDKEEELNNPTNGVRPVDKVLVIMNIDMESGIVDPQLRTILQWIAASESEVSLLHFHETVRKELILLSKRLREKEWKVGDLLHAVLKYCETMQKTSDGERSLRKPLFGWLLENA
ncbi:LOW QUALITY PROTEIN: A-kinase anchor protein 11 [Microcaecilia unicolor]|uniref:LOW QUALITY PROTEIN: A-kinase anchor protein 11 n=1 Tax=Microcaecilia unicolor TaxID=1415580 RepID=A0A6P7Y0S0_9AMPH|nr:LOW QUALITY PROTEIN: A-kinase anchor protein 11 [Microcaecilia unicolor]